eukprot:Amastigsp_a1562_3.p2 type:complete len:151 gc:universal Amastigsp_a1562_3:524-72(-)
MRRRRSRRKAPRSKLAQRRTFPRAFAVASRGQPERALRRRHGRRQRSRRLRSGSRAPAAHRKMPPNGPAPQLQTQPSHAHVPSPVPRERRLRGAAHGRSTETSPWLRSQPAPPSPALLATSGLKSLRRSNERTPCLWPHHDHLEHAQSRS